MRTLGHAGTRRRAGVFDLRPRRPGAQPRGPAGGKILGDLKVDRVGVELRIGAVPVRIAVGAAGQHAAAAPAVAGPVLPLDGVEPAACQAQVSSRAPARCPVGVDIDHAARGACAMQHARRSADNFDAFDQVRRVLVHQWMEVVVDLAGDAVHEYRDPLSDKPANDETAARPHESQVRPPRGGNSGQHGKQHIVHILHMLPPHIPLVDEAGRFGPLRLWRHGHFHRFEQRRVLNPRGLRAGCRRDAEHGACR